MRHDRVRVRERVLALQSTLDFEAVDFNVAFRVELAPVEEDGTIGSSSIIHRTNYWTALSFEKALLSSARGTLSKSRNNQNRKAMDEAAEIMSEPCLTLRMMEEAAKKESKLTDLVVVLRKNPMLGAQDLIFSDVPGLDPNFLVDVAGDYDFEGIEIRLRPKATVAKHVHKNGVSMKKRLEASRMSFGCAGVLQSIATKFSAGLLLFVIIEA